MVQMVQRHGNRLLLSQRERERPLHTRTGNNEQLTRTLDCGFEGDICQAKNENSKRLMNNKLSRVHYEEWNSKCATGAGVATILS